MTQIFDDPKSCMSSSTCAAGRRLDPPDPRSDQDDRFASVPPGVRGDQPPTLRRDGGRRSVRLRDIRRLVTRAGRADIGRARAGVHAAPLGGGPAASPQIVMTRPPRLRGSEEIAFVDRRGLA